jgi:hypothetical protein
VTVDDPFGQTAALFEFFEATAAPIRRAHWDIGGELPRHSASLHPDQSKPMEATSEQLMLEKFKQCAGSPLPAANVPVLGHPAAAAGRTSRAEAGRKWFCVATDGRGELLHLRASEDSNQQRSLHALAFGLWYRASQNPA